MFFFVGGLGSGKRGDSAPRCIACIDSAGRLRPTDTTESWGDLARTAAMFRAACVQVGVPLLQVGIALHYTRMNSD